MPRIEKRKNESIDGALRRFKRACENAGLFDELRKRESYEKPTTRRKRERAAAVSRERRRMRENTGRVSTVREAKEEKAK